MVSAATAYLGSSYLRDNNSILDCETVPIAMKKVFIGGLPKSLTDEKLRDFFKGYGEIIDFVVMKDPYSKESRGFGFIEFDNEEPVNQIIKARPHMIDGREIEVRRAMPKDITHATIHERTKRLFVGGLNYDVSEDALSKYFTDKFSKYGKVESVEIKRERETNTSRGFGFVTFDSEDAVDAVLILDPKPTQFGRNCEVKKSEPRGHDDSGRRRDKMGRRNSPLYNGKGRRGAAPRFEDPYYEYPLQRDYIRSRPPRYSREPYSRSGPYSRGGDTRYERSPPYQQSRYQGEAPSRYPMDAAYDRSYSTYPQYSDYRGGYMEPRSYEGGSQLYPSQRGSSSRQQTSSSSGAMNQNTQSTRTTSGGYGVRSTSFNNYEPGYRDQEMNPY